MTKFERDPLLENAHTFIQDNIHNPALGKVHAVVTLLDVIKEREKEIEFLKAEYNKIDIQYTDLLWEPKVPGRC